MHMVGWEGLGVHYGDLLGGWRGPVLHRGRRLVGYPTRRHGPMLDHLGVTSRGVARGLTVGIALHHIGLTPGTIVITSWMHLKQNIIITTYLHSTFLTM